MQTRILFSENGDDFLLNKAFDPLWHAVALRQQTNFFSVLDCHLTFLFIYLKLITHNMTLLIKMTSRWMSESLHEPAWDGMLATAKTDIIFIHV